MRPPTDPLDISRATFDLPSRVADNLFWLGRYTERVEAAVRISRAILARLFQEGDAARVAGLNAAMEILGALGYLAENARSVPERDVLAMIYDAEAPNGLVWSIHQVRRVAWRLRDSISLDAWLILNQLDQQFSAQPPAGALRVSAAQDRLNHAVSTLAAFGGMVMESMTRGDGWRFLDIGRRIERAVQMTELLRNGLAPEGPTDGGVLEAILEIADSSITYRSRYLTSLQTDLVLDLLVVTRPIRARSPSSWRASGNILTSFRAARIQRAVPRKRASRCRCSPRCNWPTCANWPAPTGKRARRFSIG